MSSRDEQLARIGLDAEGIEKAHFIGYSMGGWIGTGMAK